MYSVFISYSVPDSRVAFRIYYDLLRSGVSVYLFEKVGEMGVHFADEIYSMIEKADMFCLIDSVYARNSTWVHKECKFAYGLTEQGRKLKIIPCLVQKKGSWFETNILFPQQTIIRGIDIAGTDQLDYSEVYASGIKTLCSAIGVDFIPWSDYPRDRDFEKEISLYKLDDDTHSFLVSDYKNFAFCVDKKKQTALNRITSLIDDCEALNVNLFICGLAKAKLLVDIGDDLLASCVFKELTIKFPNDARGWAGLSASQYYIGDYVSSLNSINRSLHIVDANPDNVYNQQQKNGLLLNKFELLIALNKYCDARKCLEEATSPVNESIEFLIAKVKLELLTQKTISLQYYTLVNLYEFRLNPKKVNRLIGDLEFHIGRYYAAKYDYNNAIKHYELAHQADSGNVRYIAELALLLIAMQDHRYQYVLNQGLSLKPTTADETYYYGLVHFLNGDIKLALHYYNDSLKSEWSFYDKLIS